MLGARSTLKHSLCGTFCHIANEALQLDGKTLFLSFLSSSRRNKARASHIPLLMQERMTPVVPRLCGATCRKVEHDVMLLYQGVAHGMKPYSPMARHSTPKGI